MNLRRNLGFGLGDFLDGDRGSFTSLLLALGRVRGATATATAAASAPALCAGRAGILCACFCLL
jgi:hypothetical protein